MRPLEGEFGWTRSEIAIASTFYTLALFLLGPWYGRLYDKFGIRRVAPFAVLSYALTLAAATLIQDSIWTLYIAYFVLGVLGAGTSYMAYSRAVATWFDKGRGLALALTMCGPALAAAVIPFLLPPLVAGHGWRMGYFALSGAALLAIPLILFVIRERPRQPSEPQKQTGATLREALGTRQFWAMAIGIASVGMALVGLHLHLMPMVTDIGGSPALAAQALSLYGIGVLGGRVVTGLLLDAFSARIVVAVLFCVPPLGFALFETTGVAFSPLLGLMIGMAVGAEADAIGYLASRYFGIKSYAEIFGWLYGFMALGSAASPILTGYILDHSGGHYSNVLLMATGLCLFGAVLFATLGKYDAVHKRLANPTL